MTYAKGSFWFLSAQEFYSHCELLTKLSMTDLLDSGKNAIPVLPKVRRRGACNHDWRCSKRMVEPSPFVLFFGLCMCSVASDCLQAQGL